jgi:hypothetical protein
MAAVTGTVTRAYPQGNLGMLLVTAPDTTDAADTVAVNLATYGLAVFVGVQGFSHTTTGSVVVTENPTTSVSGTTVTLTIPAGTNNDARCWIIYALSQPDTNIVMP